MPDIGLTPLPALSRIRVGCGPPVSNLRIDRERFLFCGPQKQDFGLDHRYGFFNSAFLEPVRRVGPGLEGICSETES